MVASGLVSLVGGGVFGAVVELFKQSRQDALEKHQMFMQSVSAKGKLVKQSNEMALKSTGFAWTRRVIALAITSVVVGVFWFGDKTMIPNEITEGASYLFGLFDNTTVRTEFIEFDGRIVLPVLIDGFFAVLGVFLGSSTAKR